MAQLGVEPAAVIGHSVGEYAAATVAGVFSVEDGAALIAERARLMQSLPPGGAMAAIFGEADLVRPVVAAQDGAVSIAAINGPQSTTISGRADAVQAVVDYFVQRKTVTKPLNVSHAFHSALMDPILDDFSRAAARVSFSKPNVPFVCNVGGDFADDSWCDAGRWVRQIREAVRFYEGVKALEKAGFRTALEVGPAPILLGAARRCVAEDGWTWNASLKKDVAEHEQMLLALGGLHCVGVGVNWQEVYAAETHRKVSLPGYAFQRQQYWYIDQRGGPATASSKVALAPAELIGESLHSPLHDGDLFEQVYSVDRFPLLDEHRLFGSIVVAGSLHIARAIAAVGNIERDGCVIEDLEISRAMVLTDGGALVSQLVIDPVEGGRRRFRIFSRSADDDQWTLHISGFFRVGAAVATEELAVPPPDDAISGDEYYQRRQKGGLYLGPSFRWIDAIDISKAGAIARLRQPSAALTPIVAISGIIDAMLQSVASLLDARDVAELPPVPVSVGSLAVAAGVPAELSGLATARDDGPAGVIGEAVFADGERLWARLTDVRIRQAKRQSVLKQLYSEGSDWLYEVQLHSASTPAARKALAGRWVVVADLEDSLTAAVSDRLKASGAKVDTVSAAELDAEEPTLPALHADDRVLYLTGSELSSTQLWSMMLVSRWVAKSGGAQLFLASRGAADDGGEPARWANGALAISRVLRNESAKAMAKAIDLAGSWSTRKQAEALVAELAADDDEQELVLDDSGRRAQRLVRYDPAASAERPFSVAEDGSYLITGGLGALGRLVARWLVTLGARKLLLVGRGGPSQQAKLELAELAEAGAEVEIIRGDISTAEGAQAIRKAIAGQRALRGVVHAAGVLRDSALISMDRTAFSEVLQPKIAGALQLIDLLDARSLDFLIFFSSTAPIIGSAGQANYAGANAYLDSLARELHRAGWPALSINWGPWAERGMAAELIDSLGQQWGFGAISPDAGIRLTDELVRRDVAQAAVLPVDWRRFAARYEDRAQRPPALLSEFVDVRPTPVRSRPLTAEVAAAQTDPAEKVASVVRYLLRLSPTDPLDYNERLDEQGVDSLLSLDLVKALEADSGQSLPSTLLWEYPSINAIVGYLADLDREQRAGAAAGGGERERIAERIVTVVRRLLRLGDSDEIDHGARLDEQGVDSLLALDVIKALEAQTGTTLPSTLLWEYPSVDDLADYMIAEGITP